MAQVLDERSAEEIAASHPLLEWYGRMAVRGVSVRGFDIVLDPSLSGRFAVGLEEDGGLLLGVLVEDAPHLLSVRWLKADMVRKFRDRDWLVLSGKAGDEDTDIRFFIPMADVVSNIFQGHRLDRLRIRRMKMLNGKPVVAKGSQGEIELSMTGY